MVLVRRNNKGPSTPFAMVTTAHSLGNRIRRITVVAAPPEQQAKIATLSRAIEEMVSAAPQNASLLGLTVDAGLGAYDAELK
jgi:hypothetical protein